LDHKISGKLQENLDVDPYGINSRNADYFTRKKIREQETSALLHNSNSMNVFVKRMV